MQYIEIIVLGLKAFKTLCYTKVFIEQLVFINPFIWPISLIWDLTDPYFALIGKFFPNFIGRKIGFNFNVILGVELLNFLIQVVKVLLYSHKTA